MKLLQIVFFLCLSVVLLSQERLINSPALSPLEKVETKVGVSSITIEYSRPSTRGRTIFGDLLPYGKLWRTGANKNNRITFSDPTLVAGVKVDAGDYTLLSIPGEKEWRLFLFPYIDSYGVADTMDVSGALIATTTVPIACAPRKETMSMELTDITPNTANISLVWENVMISIPIQIPTKEILEKRITRIENSFSDDLSAAAWTYYDKEKNVELAYQCIVKAIALNEGEGSFEDWLKTVNNKDWSAPWNYMMHAQTLADMGKYKEAIASAERSLAVAEIVKSKYYKETNTENIKEWKALLNK